jgi:hypothetical protein
MFISLTVELLWFSTVFEPAHGFVVCVHYKPAREQSRGAEGPIQLIPEAEL